MRIDEKVEMVFQSKDQGNLAVLPTQPASDRGLPSRQIPLSTAGFFGIFPSSPIARQARSSEVGTLMVLDVPPRDTSTPVSTT